MPDEHEPSRDYPWVRVRDQFGNELDRHYEDPGVLDGTFEVIEGYPPNRTAQARETKNHTAKSGRRARSVTPADQAKGEELAERLEAAGLTESAANLTADEKRALLLEHEATHQPDPSQEG